MKRVVVTGLGLITSIGTGYDESWNSLLQGKSGIKIIDHLLIQLTFTKVRETQVIKIQVMLYMK